MRLTQFKYIAYLSFSLCLVSCTQTDKWGYDVNHKEYPGKAGNSAYKEMRDAEVVYNNNLLSINETLFRSEFKRYWGPPMGDDVIPAKTENAIVGPCPYADKKNWECGGYQMFNGQLSFKNQNMFKK